MTLTTVVPFEVFVLLFLASVAYIALRIYQCLKSFLPWLTPFWFIIVCILIFALAVLSFVRSSLPIGTGLKSVLGVFGGYWMGGFVYLLILFVIADVVLLALRIAGLVSFPVNGQIRSAVGITVFVAAVIIVTAGVIHANNIISRSYEAETLKSVDGRQWNIVLISDLHLGAVNSEKRLEKTVERINAANPDIVCISGDIFDNDFQAIRDRERCAGILRKIKAEYGVFACLGNHDTGSTLNDMIAFLPECGIELLAEICKVIDGSLVLVGRLDRAPIGESGEIKRGDFETIISGVDTSLPVVVMDHNPAHIDEYTDQADLILCGHTHRGQIFPGNLFTKRLFPVDFGKYRKDDTSPTVIVSSGVGTWGMPMRVGTDSEVVSVLLSGKQ